MEHFSDQDPQAKVRASIAERAQEQISWIEEGARTIDSEATLEEVFPLPPEVRDDAPVPDWNEEQKAVARGLGERLGYAAEKNVPSGLHNSVALLEGGKVWKIKAEAEALAEEDAKTIVVSGSRHRLAGEDEKEFLVAEYEKMLNELPGGISDEKQKEFALAKYKESLGGFTEYDYATQVAIALTTSGEKTVLPFGYALSEGNPLVAQETGQFVQYGMTAKGQTVIAMRVDREDYVEEGKQKYRYQPEPMRRMGILSDILHANGDEETPVVFMTSNAYASRQVDAIRAGLKNGRQYGVSMYGRETLAQVKGEPMQPGARLNQLTGDIRQKYEKLQKLRSEALKDLHKHHE